jgi:hypothetical protein
MIEYTVQVYDNGAKEWYLNNQRHREDGPAVVGADGTKYWFRYNKKHNQHGPAVEYPDGTKFWFLNGKRLTEEEHKKATESTVEMTVEDICKALGKNVKVVK